jgi:hypothetical protein
MVSFRFPIIAALAAASTTNALVVMLLNSTVYPNVADHHCLAAFCGNLGFTSRNYGFHRAITTHYIEERRQVVGCNTTLMQCGGNNMICDQIPYPQTYDGGLGCYAQDWVAAGRPLSYLYSTSTRRCVPSAEQVAHETALNTFYNEMGIVDGQIYSVDVALIGTTGLADPKAVYCNKFVEAYAAGNDFGPICNAAANDGTQYGLLSKCVLSGSNACPSRNYRRHHGRDANPLKSRQTNGILFPPLNFTQTAIGVPTVNLFGGADVGNQVWTHTAKLTTGTTTKTIQVATSFNLLDAVGNLVCGILGFLGLCH